MTARAVAPAPAVPPKRCENCYCWGIEDDDGMAERVCCGNSPANCGTFTDKNWSCPSWVSKDNPE